MNPHEGSQIDHFVGCPHNKIMRLTEGLCRTSGQQSIGHFSSADRNPLEGNLRFLSLQVAMRIIDHCVTVIAQSSNLFIWAKKTGTSATIQSETFREKTLKNQYFKDMHLIFLFVRPLAGM